MSSAEAFKIYSESDEVSVDMPGQSNSKFCSRQTLEFERLQTLLSVEKQEFLSGPIPLLNLELNNWDRSNLIFCHHCRDCRQFLKSNSSQSTTSSDTRFCARCSSFKPNSDFLSGDSPLVELENYGENLNILYQYQACRQYKREKYNKSNRT